MDKGGGWGEDEAFSSYATDCPRGVEERRVGGWRKRGEGNCWRWRWRWAARESRFSPLRINESRSRSSESVVLPHHLQWFCFLSLGNLIAPEWQSLATKTIWYNVDDAPKSWFARLRSYCSNFSGKDGYFWFRFKNLMWIYCKGEE